MQRHPAKNQILHMDLQRVLENEKVRMRIPLHFKGAAGSPGVKTQGGVVSHLLNDVEVSCLPKDLPEYLEVDMSAMEMNDMKRLSDIPLPPGVELVRSRTAATNRWCRSIIRAPKKSRRLWRRRLRRRLRLRLALRLRAAGAERRRKRPSRLPPLRRRRAARSSERAVAAGLRAGRAVSLCDVSRG